MLDDLFDKENSIPENYRGFIDHPEMLRPSNNYDEILQNFYLKGLEYSKNPTEIKERAQLVFESQVKSLKQKNTQDQKLQKKICFDKGGSSFLYYRNAIDYKIDASEEIFLNHLGGLMQLSNDIFDVWKDREEGIYTLANLAPTVKQMKKIFIKEMKINQALSKNLKFNPENIEFFNQLTRLALSRVFVCLEQYQKLEKKYRINFSEIKGKRKEFICDMEKPINKLKSVWFYLQY